MNIAIIPARGGSKRIPKKNIKHFHGKPIITYSIKAAIESQCFDRIIVSTDDDEIASISKAHGAEVPFKRPQLISDDYTGTTEVISHAINWIINQKENINFVCCLYPTAPFIQPNDIRFSLKKLQAEDADFCFSVTNYLYPIQRSLKINPDNRCEMFYPEMFNQRSQDLIEAYHDAGQFYWGRTNAWLGKKPIFSNISIPYILPSHRVHDIDTLEDWKRAELMFKSRM
jgi:pseudaminic acid cytidylyltransferase